MLSLSSNWIFTQDQNTFSEIRFALRFDNAAYLSQKHYQIFFVKYLKKMTSLEEKRNSRRSIFVSAHVNLSHQFVEMILSTFSVFLKKDRYFLVSRTFLSQKARSSSVYIVCALSCKADLHSDA